MKNFIVGFLAFVLSTNAYTAGVQPPASVPSITVGGRVFTDTTNLIILNCLSSGTVSTCRKQSASSGYQVTAGKTLKIQAISCDIWVASAGNGYAMAYQDTDSGINGTIGTNPVYFMGTSGQPSIICGSSAAAGTVIQKAIDWQIPATKYPTMVNVGTSTIAITLYGYEQ